MKKQYFAFFLLLIARKVSLVSAVCLKIIVYCVYSSLF